MPYSLFCLQLIFSLKKKFCGCMKWYKILIFTVWLDDKWCIKLFNENNIATNSLLANWNKHFRFWIIHRQFFVLFLLFSFGLFLVVVVNSPISEMSTPVPTRYLLFSCMSINDLFINTFPLWIIMAMNKIGLIVKHYILLMSRPKLKLNHSKVDQFKEKTC